MIDMRYDSTTREQHTWWDVPQVAACCHPAYLHLDLMYQGQTGLQPVLIPCLLLAYAAHHHSLQEISCQAQAASDIV